MKLSTIIAFLFSLFQLPAVRSASYNVVFTYTMTEEAAAGDGCIDYEDQLGSIRDRALLSAGLSLAGNSQNWMPLHGRNENAANGNNNGRGNDPDFEGRLLRGCYKTCESLCAVTRQTTWCDCCSCCYTQRRYLKASPELDIETIEANAILVASDILEVEGSDIACLAPDYELEVRIEMN